jgi:ATP-dependent Clp protease protease subunit
MPNGNPAIPPLSAVPEVYATFAGSIDQSALQRIFLGISGAMATKIQRIHLLFQSTGGSVPDGVCLYNYLHSLPIEICLYNVGSVASIAAVAYLGAKVRRVSATATFMLHRTHVIPQSATAARLQAIGKSVTLDDERTEEILRKHLQLPDELWGVHEVADLWLSADEAVRYGLATEIAEFSPPFGTQLFNV